MIQEDKETIFDGNMHLTSDIEEGETPTVFANEQKPAVVVHLASGKAYVLQSALTRMGRSEKRCDIVLADNMFVGNCHAEIIQYADRYYLHDMGSVNGTFVHDQKLPANEKAILNNMAVFQLYNEPFVFICDSLAQRIAANDTVYFLQNVHSKGAKLISEERLFLDRGHKWEDGTLSDEKISRSKKHAVVSYRDNQLWLEDLGSSNGTYLNGQDIRGKEPQCLKAADQIRLGDTVLEVGIITL